MMNHTLRRNMLFTFDYTKQDLQNSTEVGVISTLRGWCTFYTFWKNLVYWDDGSIILLFNACYQHIDRWTKNKPLSKKILIVVLDLLSNDFVLIRLNNMSNCFLFQISFWAFHQYWKYFLIPQKQYYLKHSQLKQNG